LPIKTIKLSSIEPNPNNPRIIRDTNFKSLIESIKRDPEFLEKRGIVHADGIILGGNQRYAAIKEALKDESFRALLKLSKGEIPASWVQDASDWSDEKKRRFIVVDNGTTWGEWDFDVLANEFSDLPLVDLGVDIPKHWSSEPPGGQEGEGGGAEPLDNAQIITCPNCNHQFSVLKEKKGKRNG